MASWGKDEETWSCDEHGLEEEITDFHQGARLYPGYWISKGVNESLQEEFGSLIR